jgi:hypothetical protein
MLDSTNERYIYEMNLRCVYCSKTVRAEDSGVFFYYRGKIYLSCSSKCRDSWMSSDSIEKEDLLKKNSHRFVDAADQGVTETTSVS